jgi:hypothetical protein
MAVITPAQTIIVTDTDPALQRDYGNTIQGTISPLTQNAIIYVNTTSILNSYTNVLGGASAGNAGEIQFNEAGGFAADTGLVYNPVTDSLIVGGTTVTTALATDILLHSNGQPWTFTTPNTAAGGNPTELQFNDAGFTNGIPTVRFFSGNGVLSLGAVNSIKINGGSAGQALLTDGNGNLNFGVVTPAAAGNTTQLQFNNSNVLAGAANFTYDTVTETVAANLFTANRVTANTVNVAANINVSNIIASGNVSITGNLTSGNFTTAAITAGILNATGNVTSSSNVNAVNANISSTLTVANITASNITATGNIAFSGTTVNIGAVGNLKITGGALGRILGTDGTGNLSWVVPVATPGGSNTQLQFNDNSVLRGAANVTYNKVTDTLNVSNAAFTANVQLGNVPNVHINGGGNNINAANVTVNINNGVINSVVLAGTANAGGQGYTLPPVITPVDANGNAASYTTAAVITPVLDAANGAIVSVAVTSGGSGYNGGVSGTLVGVVAPVGRKYLSTDGTGNLNWYEVAIPAGNMGGGSTGNGVPGGPATAVQINGGGTFVGSGALTFNTGTSTLTTLNLVVPSNATVSGNLTAANLTTSNLTTANLTTTNVTATGNAAFSGANVSLGAVANLKITGGANGLFLRTDGTGNLTFADVVENSLVNGNSNVIVTANSNITMSVAGNANVVVVSDTGINVTSNVTATSNVNSGNVNATNGVFAANLSATGLVSAATANVGFLNANNNVAFTGANVSLGAVGNLKITGGSNLQYLQTDGTGNVTFALVSNISNGTSSVNVAASANVTVTSAGSVWKFATNGVLTLPGNTSTLSSGTLYNNGAAEIGSNAQAAIHFNTGNGQANANLSSEGWVFADVNGIGIDIYNDAGLKHWQFDPLGNLTLPGNSKLSPSGANLENIDLIAGANGWAELQSNNGNSYMWVDNDGAYIGTDWGNNAFSWTFANTGVLTAPGLVVAPSMRANAVTSNNFIFGNATTTISNTKWLGASTTAVTANQVIYTANSANITSIDFHVTATGVTGSGNSRQVAKLLAVTLDSTTNFTEYGGMWVGANLGDFNVIQTGSNLELVVTPTTANTVQYNVILTTYF